MDKIKTAEKFYDEMRKQGLTDNITSNMFPSYDLPFYQDIFRLMTEYANQDKWISVRDRKPDPYSGYVVTLGFMLAIMEYKEDGKWYEPNTDKYHEYYAESITHWMELPNPPKP